MKRSGSWSGVILSAVILVAFASGIQAATTVMHVKLGDNFNGAIGAAGVDVVQARFNVVAGTPVRITAKAMSGSTLQPTLVLKDGSGTTMDIGTTQHIEWLPIAHVIRSFTAPASGNYIAELGGTSGSGSFRASITGSVPAGVELATLSGTVTNSFTGDGIAGVEVHVGPYLVVTDSAGNYSLTLPTGDYTVMFQGADFVTVTETVELDASTPASLSVGLMYTTPVVVNASVSGSAVPGADIAATVVVDARDGSSIQSISWTQSYGATAAIAGADTANATVTLPAQGDYKDELIHVLREPPVGPNDLPPNVPFPEGEFVGGLQDRFQVVGINPFSLEEAGLVTLEVEVTTSSGTYHDEVEIHAALPWKWTNGIRSVPVGVPVLLHGKEQALYDWSLTPAPGSSAALTDGSTQSPWFTPDLPGLYELEVFSEPDKSVVTLQIHAGNWRGVIVGQDFAGRPVSDEGCTTTCHATFAPDKFTPWAQTGHAEIFTNNLNTSTHYGPNCFPCHTVGYDAGVANGGFDNASDYASFVDAGLINHPGDNWDTVVDEFPATARLSNIQCENCHGPQDAMPGEESDAHGWQAPEGEPRVDLSSDVCAFCHGEPLRHARFQQWQLSAHANYELAVDEGDSGNCSRCHTANGFLAWWPVLIDNDPETDPLDSVTVEWTLDEVHPQTCATCHDPHAIGTTSGAGTNATVRISGDTPPLIGGFTATDVGRGAICMTCHNSRRGLRNDDTFDDFYGTSEAARAPHGSAQGDVLMGQNAYLIPVGNRGSHSFLEDTCVTCHMEATPPPSVLSYNQGGSNHTFFASPEICSDCHEGLDASAVQNAVHDFLDELQGLVEQGILDLIAEQIDAGNTIDLNGAALITDAGDVAEIVFGEARGRQAITVTFTDDTTVGPFRMTDVDVLDGFSAVIGQLYDFADPLLIKAGWNWALFHNDGSLGVHNPLFAFQGLVAARDALSASGRPAALPLERGTRSRSDRISSGERSPLRQKR